MDIANAILHGLPGSQFSVGDSYESLEFSDGTKKPSLETVESWHSVYLEKLKIKNYRAAVGLHIDGLAQSFGFDSIITAVSYANEPADPLNQSYGVALRAWRSLCWEKCREVLATWQGGGEEPTVEELIASLPAFVAP